MYFSDLLKHCFVNETFISPLPPFCFLVVLTNCLNLLRADAPQEVVSQTRYSGELLSKLWIVLAVPRSMFQPSIPSLHSAQKLHTHKKGSSSQRYQLHSVHLKRALWSRIPYADKNDETSTFLIERKKLQIGPTLSACTYSYAQCSWSKGSH